MQVAPIPGLLEKEDVSPRFGPVETYPFVDSLQVPTAQDERGTATIYLPLNSNRAANLLVAAR